MSEKIEPVAEDFHDRLYGLTFKLFLNPNEDTPNNEVRLVLGATVGSGESEVAYFHAEQGVLHDATTVSALEARIRDLETDALRYRELKNGQRQPFGDIFVVKKFNRTFAEEERASWDEIDRELDAAINRSRP